MTRKKIDNYRNGMQDKRIDRCERSIEHLTECVVSMETERKTFKEQVDKMFEQVFNHLPHQIQELKDKLTIGLAITIAVLVLSQIVLKMLG